MSAFLIGIDAEASAAWTYGDSAGLLEVEAALSSVGASVVRVWDVPYEIDRPWNWLVVTDLANPLDSYDLLGGAGVEVGGVAPLLLGQAETEIDASTEVLPQKLDPEVAHTLHRYLAPGLSGVGMSVGPGVFVWPCCGGVGAHLDECHLK